MLSYNWARVSSTDFEVTGQKLTGDFTATMELHWLAFGAGSLDV